MSRVPGVIYYMHPPRLAKTKSSLSMQQRDFGLKALEPRTLCRRGDSPGHSNSPTVAKRCHQLDRKNMLSSALAWGRPS